MKRILIPVTILVFLVGVFSPVAAPHMTSARASAQLAWPDIDFTPVTGGLDRPLHITHAGDGSGRLFVVEQGGTIKIIKNGQLSGTFLDIREEVFSPGDPGAGSEEGLLSIAFPPGYAQKQYFYVYYTNELGDNQISRFNTSSNPDVADSASEKRILLLEHPTYHNHNGGQLLFGPDGYLYAGTGDGAGDNENAQDPGSLLGKLLRLNVEGVGGGGEFDQQLFLPLVLSAGSTSPQPGNAVQPEIWALGLRNPWRFSFDRQTGDFYLGDVGEQTLEEVDFRPAPNPAGVNYGWDILEGTDCFEPSTGCSQPAGYVPPIFTYSHAENNPQGCSSVTGGFVYRGSAYPGLQGIYLFADFCSGKVWGAVHASGAWSVQILKDTSYAISSFGEDQAGELYLLDLYGGTVYQVIVN